MRKHSQDEIYKYLIQKDLSPMTMQNNNKKILPFFLNLSLWKNGSEQRKYLKKPQMSSKKIK